MTVDVLAIAVAIYLIVRPTPRRALIGLGAAVAGAAVAWFSTWLFGDVLDFFGVELTPVTRMWSVLGGAAVGLAIANLFQSRWWRKLVAAVSILLFVLTAGAGINVEFGEYRNISDVLGVVPYPDLALHAERGEVAAVGTDYAKTWTPQAPMPAKGQIGKIHIPSPVSGFHAREAVVYLPPAALTPDPPVLPVLYAFSGQPGAPENVFTNGRIGAAMDAWAAKHGGVAPIVVAADQLGGPGRNPMCVDSAQFGRSATYLLVDVRKWVQTHFRVSSDPAAWGVFGYSQGATCAVQFAAAHPEIFGSALASSSELGPTLGHPGTSIAAAFGGSPAAFRAAQPASVMSAHAPYADSLMVFGVGQNDKRYTRFAQTLRAAADAAGIRTSLIISPHSAHDWATVRYVIAHGFPLVAAKMGLNG